MVAVNIDRGGGDKPKSFLAETGATHLSLYTDPTAKLFSKLKAVGMPTTLLIDREGHEIGRLVGPADWDLARGARSDQGCDRGAVSACVRRGELG